MGKRVLIVDDAPVMRAMLKTILAKDGYETAGEAGDGADGVALYHALRPDVVMLDTVMPGMAAPEAVRRIKAADPTARIVLCGSMGQAEIVRAALAAGATSFVSKPFAPARVREALNEVLD